MHCPPLLLSSHAGALEETQGHMMFIVTETAIGNSCVAAVLNQRGQMMELKPPVTLQETSL